MGEQDFKKVWNDMSLIYDQARVKSYFQNSLNIILKNIPQNSSVLEVGCGTGMYCIELAKRGYKVKGFDYSEKMIKKAIENAWREGVNVDFVIADAEEKIPFSDKFDFAICLATWECFPKPAKVLNNVHHSLTQEGRFIVITSNPYVAPFIILAEKLKIKKLAPAYVYFNSFEHRIRKWARDTKFMLEKKEYSYHYLDIVFHLKKAGEE